MNLLPRLWTTSQELTSDPFRAMRREMENALRAFDQNSPAADIGAGAPAVSVSETKDAYEVTAKLPGVDAKDIKPADRAPDGRRTKQGRLILNDRCKNNHRPELINPVPVFGFCRPPFFDAMIE